MDRELVAECAAVLKKKKKVLTKASKSAPAKSSTNRSSKVRSNSIALKGPSSSSGLSSSSALLVGKNVSKGGKGKSSAMPVPSPSPSPFDAINDECLANILGRITDVKLLARCAASCRRWRRICRQVPVLRLELRKMQAWQAEGVLSQALYERKGVRDLEVRFVCPRKHPSDGVRESRVFGCLWRLAISIETLALLCPNTVYFKLWSWLTKFPKLSNLKLHYGRIEEIPIPGCLDALRSIEFLRVLMSGPMLEALVNSAPLLQHLILVGCDPIESLQFENQGLRSLDVVATEEYPMARLDLTGCPNLTDLSICHIENLKVNGHELLHLGLYSTCHTRIGCLQNLRSLEIYGKEWPSESVEHILCYAQNILHMELKACITDTRPVRIEHYLSPLTCLQSLMLEGNLLQCFCEGIKEVPFEGDSPKFALRKLAVKLSNDSKESSLWLKALIGCCPKMQLVIIDTVDVDWETEDDERLRLRLMELTKISSEECHVIFYDNPKQEMVKEISDILNSNK